MQDNLLKSSLELDADDSSDEEEVCAKAENYDVKKSYKEFIKSKKVPKYIRTADPKGYSFIAFALGTQKLYSPEVNQAYYKKKHALPKSSVAVPKDKIIHWLENTLSRALRNVFKQDSQSQLTKKIS